MTPERFSEIFHGAVDKACQLVNFKGGEYAPGNDRLANFKQAADRYGVPMTTVWAIYAGKHWDAITTWVADIQNNQSRQRMEGIESRVFDLITYNYLLLGIIEEMRKNGEIPEEEPVS